MKMTSEMLVLALAFVVGGLYFAFTDTQRARHQLEFERLEHRVRCLEEEATDRCREEFEFGVVPRPVVRAASDGVE